MPHLEEGLQIKLPFQEVPCVPLLWITELSLAVRGSYEKVRDQCSTEGGISVLNNTEDYVMEGDMTPLPMMLTCFCIILVPGRTGIVHLGWL